MKNDIIIKTAFLSLTLASILTSCNAREDKSDTELEEEAKVGKIFDPSQQGPSQENRENQFPASRNSNKKGMGQETGAPSDTAKVTSAAADAVKTQDTIKK